MSAHLRAEGRVWEARQLPPQPELDVLPALWGWKVRAGSERVLLSVTCLPRAGETGSSAPGIRPVQLGDAVMAAWL